uniref:Phospholipid-transporting ATPase n=1 Tax=Crassostrea virginica TaxID=6565 RepID=A0A8B8EBD0_CRAVI|nr:probable phospholipid-transporting ATPase IF isoform X7 [Crassostrea virginica]XP_022336879.1 probable phospholipid-transporting ATPase IF isoform X7 [Crassostrea virginica]
MSGINSRRRPWDCFKRELPTDRTIYVDNKPSPSEGPEVAIHQHHHYPNNRVVSSKYTVWNFIPKNLFEQFRRIANFYFLCVGVIQLIIDSPVSPATSIAPLVFVVTVTAIKQGYEDWLRHKADNEVNNRKAFIVHNGKLTQVKAQNIKVGDIVKVKVNQGFPCDLVMLSSHDPEGKCYVTTANLDGETNLKTHFCVPETREFQRESDFTKLCATIECQQPIPDLYKFIGRITVYNNSDSVLKSLGQENVLLRGARLKNTPYIYGCAIYTGPDTKMALNSKAKITKFSRVERGMNNYLIIFLVILLVEALVSTVLAYWYMNQDRIGNPWYIPDAKQSLNAKNVISDFLSFMILYNYIIPISLYVTVEVQKFVGSMYLQWDLEMYDEEMDTACQANTSDLNEELGQVEYLFTDKTGTLTENDMQFRQCSIKAAKYQEVGGHLHAMSPEGGQSIPVFHFSPEIEEFLELLALCHTVRVDHHEANQTGASALYSHSGMEYEYQSSSPDEKAFVEACRRYGVVFHGTREDHLEVTFHGEMRRYKLLHVLEFDATRKRMSVIIQKENDEIVLLCKGAETAVLKIGISGEIDKTNQHIHDYAVLGLRTLALGKRVFSSSEYESVDRMLTEARNAMENREDKLNEAFQAIEKDLHIMGATAVEDRLQDGVPETITTLRRAGIKVWVLTGDKEETAVNISYSAGHIHDGMEELRVTKVTCTDHTKCGEEITKNIHRCASRSSSSQQFVLIVDGFSLTFALSEHTEMFRKLCQMCAAVLCCRMSPLQKAEVVKLMKVASHTPVTAAIGDGANDVSMIQEAHVGLGIMGKEGRQAVRNSDYAFAKFRFLQRLLLVHGHYFYYRLATLVQYFFYKNVAFITMQLFFAFYSAFSQQSLLVSFHLMFYNITMTSLPIFIYSLFEQHISQHDLLDKPHLYKNITRNSKLDKKNFLQWNILGLWHVFVFFFGVVFLFGNDVSLWPNGKMMDLWSFGTIAYTVNVIAVNLKLCLETYYWPLPMFMAYVITGVGNLGMTLVYSMIRWPSLLQTLQDYYMVYTTSLSSGTVWLCIVVLAVIALLPDLLIRVHRDTTNRIAESTNRRKLPANKLSVSFTKRSGTLTLSQVELAEDF